MHACETNPLFMAREFVTGAAKSHACEVQDEAPRLNANNGTVLYVSDEAVKTLLSNDFELLPIEDGRTDGQTDRRTLMFPPFPPKPPQPP